MVGNPIRRQECVRNAIFGISVAIQDHRSGKNETAEKWQSLTFQAAKLAAMMPFWLCHELDWIARIAYARIYLLDELWHLCWLHACGIDPAQLAPMNAEAAVRFINSHDGVFWHVLTLTIAQVEQFLVIKTIAKRPFVVEHRFHQFFFAIYLRE